MTPERQQRIKELLHATLEREPGGRTAFLEGQCAGDAALLADVVSLIELDGDDSFSRWTAPEPVVAEMPLPVGDQGRKSSDVPVISASEPGLRSCPACSNCYGDGRPTCPADGAPLVAELGGPALIDSKYVIERCLGRGGMGMVYRARHIHLGRSFALKVIRPGASSNTQFVARFNIEAAALGRLKHPGIVDVTDFGVDPRDGSLPYLVMEYLEGTSLHDHARRAGALSLEQALPILEAVATALDFAHGQGVLHRDLKGANVFLCEAPPGPPIAKIVDFGLARLLAPGPPSAAAVPTSRQAVAPAPSDRRPDPADESSLTATFNLPVRRSPARGSADGSDRITAPGQVGGTLGYIAPEVLRGEEATASSDLYFFSHGARAPRGASALRGWGEKQPGLSPFGAGPTGGVLPANQSPGGDVR